MSQNISLDGRSGGAGVNSGRGESGALTFAVCSARVIKARLRANHAFAGRHALVH